MKDFVILLGDYADRGSKGIEVIEEIENWVKRYPHRVYAVKGNHEDYAGNGNPRFTPCTLRDEVIRKKGNWMRYFKQELEPFIERLCLAVIIPGVALFVHGGVSTRIQTLQDLAYPTSEVEADLLWSDPFQGIGERFSQRGAGVEFGEDISDAVCARLGVKRIVRSHQPRKALFTPYVTPHGRVITMSSTRVYGGKPFVLKLPGQDLDASFHNLREHVQPLYS
jgi:hypothetical protein